MGQSYKQCTACGARALRIATRCPGCHREFPRTPAVVEAPAGRSQPASPRPRSSGLAAGVLVVAAVLTVTELGQTSGMAVESRPKVAADSSAGPSEVAYVSNGGTTETSPVPGTPAPSAGVLRVARTWAHVRKARSPRADLEAVLTPGDTVLADSLDRGWYRVALDGEVLGYAYESTLAGLGAERISRR
jgi:hypothetical protein